MYPIRLSEKSLLILDDSAKEFIKNHYGNRKYNRKKILEIITLNDIKINRSELEYFLNRIYHKLKNKNHTTQKTL